jgi:HK97 gp10 family phage protein
MATGVTITIRLDRIPEFIRRLPEAGEQLASAVAQEIGTDAQSRAAVDTGYMRDHIEVNKTGQGAYEIHSAAPYSGFVEEGTRYMGAQPFMRPACERGAAGMGEKAQRLWGML